MAPPTVIDVLRGFAEPFLQRRPVLNPAQRRALWALTHCRTPAMGGQVHACAKCGRSHFTPHSCNHRSCPQCGREATAHWVARELGRRVGAPYFMVTFTLPAELRGLFATPRARDYYHLFFAAAAEALRVTLANPRWLGAATSGMTMVLHTWNQRLGFHPHVHAIVPGAGLDANGGVVRVKSDAFLVPQPVLREAFRGAFHRSFRQLHARDPAPPVDPAVWSVDWGVHLQGFGDGTRAIQYLGAYLCRGPIGDSRIVTVKGQTVTFSWKDRSRGGKTKTDTIPGTEFLARYLRHVLPTGLRSIRRYGFCHPAAKASRERIALHTGQPLWIGPPPGPEPRPPMACPDCGGAMAVVLRVSPVWNCEPARAPPRAIAA